MDWCDLLVEGDHCEASDDYPDYPVTGILSAWYVILKTCIVTRRGI